MEVISEFGACLSWLSQHGIPRPKKSKLAEVGIKEEDKNTSQLQPITIICMVTT